MQAFLDRFRNTELPRKKIYISDLAELLKQRIVQPETQIGKKLFPQNREEQNYKRRSHSNSQVFNFQREAIVIKKKQHEQPMSQSTPLAQPSITVRKRMLSVGQMPSRSAPSNDSKASFQGSTFIFHAKPTYFDNFNSVQLNKVQSQPQRTYLKKGSNLQKQIVTTLLRNSSKVQAENRRYSKGEILKMIHIYKGIQENSKNIGKKVLVSYASAEGKRSKGEARKEIGGWQQDHLESQMVDAKE